MSVVKEFKATKRTRAGKGAARAERRDGLVPAVIYGGKEAPIAINLPFKEVNLRIYAGHFLTTVFAIDVEGEVIQAIPRDYQLHRVTDVPLHVDFLRITEGVTISVDVPVHVINQDASPGVKKGGLINLVTQTIEVKCPPRSIPEAFTIDLAGRDINDTVHLSDIVFPEGVTAVVKGNPTVLTIAPPPVDRSAKA